MKTIYEVSIYDGAYKSRYYDTLDNAYDYIRQEDWRSVRELLEVVITIDENGMLNATKKVLPRPRSAREVEYPHLATYKNYID